MENLRYIPRNRFAIIADETKLAMAICFSAITLLAYTIEIQLILLIVLLTIGLSGGLRLSFIIDYVKLFLPVMLIIFTFHLFYHDGQDLFNIWRFTATDFGLYSATMNLFRFLNFILVAILFFSFSSPLNVSAKLTTCFGLAKSRFFQELALVFFIALRFLPVLIRERDFLMLAMRARGADFRGNILKRLRVNVKLIFPLILRVVGQTDDVAVALALKGNGDTYFVPEKTKLKLIDISLIILMIAGIFVVLQYE